MQQEIWKRSKSFLWRLGAMALVSLLAFFSSNLDLFNLSPAVIGLVGLMMGELTKWLNSHFALEDKAIGVVRRLAGK
mgnify:CR=1 FL=1